MKAEGAHPPLFCVHVSASSFACRSGMNDETAAANTETEAVNDEIAAMNDETGDTHFPTNKNAPCPQP